MPIGHEKFLETRFFGSLDGLRCFGILGVLWIHTVRTGSLVGLPLLRHGGKGVALFFAISGFLVATLLLRERDKHGQISLRSFYVRRVLRIVPLYYTVVACYVLLIWGAMRGTPEGEAFLANLPYFLTYTNNWFIELDSRVIFYFAWALAAEIQFYLVWPLIAKSLKGHGPALAMIAILAIARMGWHGWLDSVVGQETLVRTIIAGVMTPICLGVLLAHLFHHERGYALAHRLIGSRWSGLVILVGLVVCLIVPNVPGFAIYCLIALLVGACAIREDHVLAPLLRWRLISHIGAVSYGIYLTHMLTYHVVTRVLAAIGLHYSFLDFVGTIACVTIIATISFRYYEGQFLKLRQRFERVATHRPDEDASAPTVAD